MLDCVIGLVIRTLKFAVGRVRRVGFVMEAAISERTTKALVEEQEQDGDVHAFGREAVSVMTAIALEQIVIRRSRCPRRSHDNLPLVSQIPGGRGALKLSADDAGWDRILGCIDNGGIPMARGDKKGGIWNARQSSRAIFAFYGPRPPLGRLTKEMGLTLRSSDRPGAETRNPAARMKCAGGFL